MNDNLLKENELDNDEFDLKKIYKIIIRNKRTIASITGVSIFISGVIAFSLKRIWEGEFQIVVANKNTQSSQNLAGSLLMNNSLISNALNLGGNKELKTEIEVLKSPSILMPTYNYVINNKSKNWQYSQKWRFKEWRKKSFSFELVKGTKAFNIKFRDSDKEIILPALNQISLAYKKYSNRDREREIVNGLNFLENEIKNYKKKSLDSTSRAREFASKYDLLFPITSQISNKQDFSILSKADIELARITAANQIRRIDSILSKVDEIYNENEINILYLSKSNITSSSSVSGLKSPKNNSIIDEIESINNRLGILRANYTEKNQTIINLLNQRSKLLETLKIQLKSALSTKRLELKSEINANTREKGIILKFKELISESIRDEIALNNLQQMKLKFELEKNKIKDPWDLITKPTLMEVPVGPSKKLLLMAGGIGGIFLGFIYSLYLEKKKNLIYDIEDINKILKVPLIDNCIINSNLMIRNSLEYTTNVLSKNAESNSIIIISSKSVPEFELKLFCKEVEKLSNKISITYTFNIIDTQKPGLKVYACKLGEVTYKDVNYIKKRLGLLKTNLNGWINFRNEI